MKRRMMEDKQLEFLHLDDQTEATVKKCLVPLMLSLISPYLMLATRNSRAKLMEEFFCNLERQETEFDPTQNLPPRAIID